MKVVRFSTLSTGFLTTKEIFLLFISVRGWDEPSAIVRLEGRHRELNSPRSGL
jgi:hypothetical protein